MAVPYFLLSYDILIFDTPLRIRRPKLADEGLAWDLDTHVMGKLFPIISLLLWFLIDILPNFCSGGYEFLMQNCMFYLVFFPFETNTDPF